MPENATYAFEMISKIAPTLGIRLELEPVHNYTGEMVFPNGTRTLILGRNFNINPAASFEIAKDKGYTSYFLKKKGFNVPEGRAFLSASLNKKLEPQKRADLTEAAAYAQKLGYPVYIKPNNLSQGRLVTKVHDEKSLKAVAGKIFRLTDILLIEKPCVGKDYRIVVLGDKVISAYERQHAHVVGDGKSTIAQLIQKKRAEFAKADRDADELPLHDFRVKETLSLKGLSLKSILKSGEKLQLLNNSNLSTGGTSIELTANTHPSFVKMAVKAAQALNLEFCGIDVIAQDITKTLKGQKWWIIEVNSNSQLNNCADSGMPQQKRMEGIYRLILKYLIKKHSNRQKSRI